MEETNPTFILNTSKTCVICFNPNTIPNSLFSLKRICHHLKVKLNEKESAQVSRRLLEILNKSNIKVSLCNECSDLTQTISELCEEMEAIKLKMELRFTQLEDKLKRGKEGSKWRLGYQFRLEEDAQALIHSEIVDKLRSELISKCERQWAIFHLPADPQREEPVGSPAPDPSPEFVAPQIISTTSLSIQNKSIQEVDLCSSSEEESEENQEETLMQFQDNQIITSDPLEILETSKVSLPLQSSSTSTYPTYQCRLCPVSFSSQGGLSNHMTRNHPETDFLEKKYKCRICPKFFDTKLGLKTHTNLHLGLSFRCPRCSRRFTRRDHLNVHMRHKCYKARAVVGGKLPVVNSSVDPQAKPFNQAPEDERRYQCKICNKKYTSLSSLNCHMDIHKGRQYKCGFCPKISTQRGPLYKHQCLGNCPGWDGGVDGRARIVFIENGATQEESQDQEQAQLPVGEDGVNEDVTKFEDEDVQIIEMG